MDLVGVRPQEAGSAHDLRGHEGGGDHGREAAGEGQVEGRGHEGELQAHAGALEEVEARARDGIELQKVGEVAPYTDWLAAELPGNGYEYYFLSINREREKSRNHRYVQATFLIYSRNNPFADGIWNKSGLVHTTTCRFGYDLYWRSNDGK